MYIYIYIYIYNTNLNYLINTFLFARIKQTSKTSPGADLFLKIGVPREKMKK